MNAVVPDPNELKPLTQSELEDIIEKHAMYLVGKSGGARAVIQYRNLSSLDFSEKDLSQADFTGSFLIEAKMFKAKFSGASFFACDMRNADMRRGDFSRADFRGAYVAGANLTGANMNGADMREGKIMRRGDKGVLEDRKRSGGEGSRTVFAGAKLTEVKMDEAHASAADFSDADFSGAVVTGTNLSGASFEGANLADADLSNSNLTKANMRKSVISGTLMKNVEKAGLDQSLAITEAEMGSKLENLGKSLPELLEEHTLWVATAGKAGRQLDLSGYDLRDVLDLRRFPLTAIQCIGGNFLNQNLCAAELQSANFDRSDFRDCKMIEADLRGSSFKYAQFARADLTGAMMCPLQFNKDGHERLQRIDMSGANMRYSLLRETDLRSAIMMGVDLTGATIQGCDLRRADFTGAIMTGVKLESCRLDDAIIDFGAL